MKVAFRLIGTLLLLCLFVAPAFADFTQVDTFKNIEYQQTGPATTSLAGTFFSASAFTAAAGDFTSVNLTYPGPGSPVSLTQNGNRWDYQTGFLANQAALDAAFPFGAYHFTGSDGMSSSGVDVNYSMDAYTSDIPLISNYAALQNMDPTADFTFLFPSFTPNPSATTGATYFTIFGNMGAVFFKTALPSSTTSIFMPGGTLQAGKTYSFDLIYDDRIDPPATIQAFDVRTDGQFTTSAVPEPGSRLLLGTGLAGLAGTLKRKLLG